MTTTMVGTRASVAAAMRRVWPKHTAKIVAYLTGKSVRAGEEWVQGNKRGDWDTLITLMASNEHMEREVLAMVRAEREKTLDARPDGMDGGMAAQEGRAGIGGLARRADVPGDAPVRARDAAEAFRPRAHPAAGPADAAVTGTRR